VKFNPYNYQSYVTNQIIEHPYSALFLDMGMGKTVCSLTAVSDLLYDMFEICRVLVIAPLRVAEDTWSREVDKWDHLDYLKISKILGPQKKRLEALEAKADIYVINRENVEWLVDHYKSKWPFDMVIIDELSSFKSPKANRFRALRKVRPLIKRIVGLTGTPAPNTLIDLWPQIYLLDQGERLGKTLTEYRNRYFNPGKRNGVIIYSWDLKPGAKEEIYQKISDICFSMRSKDYLDLPERIDRIVPVTLSPAAKKYYEQMEKDLVLEIMDNEITANSAAVLSNKLLQMANGAIYDEDKNVTEIHQEKLKALEEIIEVNEGKSILVFYGYKHDHDRIHGYLKNYQVRDLKTSQDISDWNNGKIKIMLSHPASSGHGLNLQDGGNIIVWFGLTWSLELYKQANARLHRQGQKNSVVINHLVAPGTVDEDVMRALERKDVNQSALLEAVKARIEKIKGRM
jgi:SNF2 family DNA or RNA helicase